MAGGGGDPTNVFSFRCYERIQKREREIELYTIKTWEMLKCTCFHKVKSNNEMAFTFLQNVHGFTIYTNVLFTLDTFLVIE